jgi:hypothetical protein
VSSAHHAQRRTCKSARREGSGYCERRESVTRQGGKNEEQ